MRKPLMMKFWTAAILISGATAASAPAWATTGDVGDIGVIPTDAGVYNVKSYGAIGHGDTNPNEDDTAAIQNAISTARRTGGRDVVVYFPNGTYNITSAINFRDNAASSTSIWYSYIELLGQSQAGVILKLKNNLGGSWADATGACWSAKPVNCINQSVIYTGGDTGSNNGVVVWDGDSNGAYNNFILNMTIDTGTGNPGAIGIHWIGNNCGAIRNVTIRGQGLVGLDMPTQYPGPMYAKGITINGFSYGMRGTVGLYNVTMSNINLQDQTKAGILTGQYSFAMENLQANEPAGVPVVEDNGGAFALIGAHLSGGDSNTAAFQVSNGGEMYARVASSSWSGTVMTMNGASVSSVAGPQGSTYSSKPALKLLSSTPSRGLDLPVVQSPDYVDSNPNDWVNATAYGGADDSARMQAAIDYAAANGKTTVYVPHGTYRIPRSINVHGNVRRIIGFGAQFYLTSDANRFPPFTFNGLTAPLQLELLSGDDYFLGMSGTGGQTLFFKDLGFGWNYSTNAGSNKLFFEDVGGAAYHFNNETVYGRQMDPESASPHFSNTNGTLWILGLKTEGNQTILQASGGNTEAIGGFFLYQPASVNSTLFGTPFICQNNCNWSAAGLLFNSLTSANGAPSSNPPVFQETRGNATASMTYSQLGDYRVPLFAGFAASSDTTPPSAPTGLSATAVSGSQINLSWTASTDNVGVVGYYIYRNGNQVGTATGATYSDFGLSPSTSYSYTVKAYDAAGNQSAASVSVSATTLTGGGSSTNLIQDPGFELQSGLSGSALQAPWVSEGVAQTGFDIAGGNPHSGQKDGFIYSPSAAAWTAITQTVTVMPNTSYTLSAWIDNSNTSEFAGSQFGVRTVGATVLNQTAIPLSGTYMPLTISFNSGSNTALVMFAGYTPGDGTSWMHLDDVSLTAVTANACDLNGDGSVTVADVQLEVNKVLGVTTPCGTADINEDGQCTVADVQRIVNAVLGGVCKVGP